MDWSPARVLKHLQFLVPDFLALDAAQRDEHRQGVQPVCGHKHKVRSFQRQEQKPFGDLPVYDVAQPQDDGGKVWSLMPPFVRASRTV